MNTSNHEHDRERKMQQAIVDQLEHERATLDPLLQQRLDRARRQAVASADQPPAALSPWPWLATAGAVSLAIIMTIGLNTSETMNPPDTLDLDLLTLAEFELLDQDPAFMAWLAEQDTQVDPGAEAGAGGSS